jgi:hypothetical protein
MSDEMITTELGFPLQVVEREEAAGRWPDLTRLEARRPDMLAACVWMLARGVSVRSICKALGLSPCTVQRVREDVRWREAVVTQQQGVVGMVDEILRLTVEDVLDKAREGKLPAVFALKLLFDIRQLLSGGVTARTEVRVTSEEEDFQRFLAAARAQAPAMGLEGGNVSALGAGGERAAAAPVEIEVETVAMGATGDCQSLDNAR